MNIIEFVLKLTRANFVGSRLRKHDLVVKKHLFKLSGIYYLMKNLRCQISNIY
jgi:hypothetical protein